MRDVTFPFAGDLLRLDLMAQPDDVSCGPTCLNALYRYYDDEVPLKQLQVEIPSLETGGTLAVNLGLHALTRGYRARLYTYNLRIFDPTWFTLSPEDMEAKLRSRAQVSVEPKRRLATEAYAEFARLGGELRMADLEAGLLRKYLRKGVPILTGLSSTYLYQSPREMPDFTCRDDDIKGEPAGHFVILTGYDPETKEAFVSDPYEKNPIRRGTQYRVRLERLVTAILLGVLTYDANLLVIRPADDKATSNLERRQLSVSLPADSGN